MVRRLVWLVFAGSLFAALLMPAARAQQPGVEFAVQPGPGSQTAPGRGYFLIEAGGGDRVRQTLLVRNESGRPVQLRLAAVDATTGQLGGVSYGLPQDPVEVTGSWISIDRTRVSLGEGEATTLGFRVSVPQDAGEGEHIAGIAVWEAGEETDDGGDEAVSVVVQTRRIIAVQVELPGAQAPELVISGVQPAARPDGLYLEIGITNEGTAMTTGDGTIEIPAQGFLRDFPVDTFVPGTSIGYPLKWTDDPQEGEYEAAVTISYEGGVAEWAGTFTVGDPVLDELEDRGVAVARGLPLVLIATAVAGLAAVGALVWWRLRRRGQGRPLPAYQPVPGRPGPQQLQVPSAGSPLASRRIPPPPPPPPPSHGVGSS